MVANAIQVDFSRLEGVFSSLQNSVDSQTGLLQRLVNNDDARAAAEARSNKMSSVSKAQKGDQPGFGSSFGSSFGSKAGAGIGGGIGSIASIAALGLAIPAFFGGLLAGNEGLAWLDSIGADLNYTALGSAVEGFSGVIDKASPKALIALAGLMAVEGFSPNPAKGALGLAAMGAAIPAFLGGLLIGDAVFETAQNWLGADFDFAATGRVLEGFSSMIGNLSPTAGIALAGLVGGGFLVSRLSDKNPLKVGLAMAVMGAAVPALIGGLLIGEAALEGIQWLGVSLDFSALGTAFEGFSSAIGKLTPEAGVALATLLGGAGIITSFGGSLGDAATIAAVMTGLGAGISGLMIGLSVGEVGLSWISKLQAEGEGGLAWMFEMFSNAVDKLSEPATKHLAIILGAGTALGAFLGTSTTPAGALAAAAGIALIMTGIGAGISGLMIGLGAGEVGLSWLSKLQSGEGEGGLAWAMGAFNDAILAISDEAIDKMAKIATSGAGGGLKDLALGMIGFLTAEGMSEVGNVWSTIKDGVQGAVNWLFGTNFGETKEKSTIEKMVDSLEPLKTLDPEMITKMSIFSDAITKFVSSFDSLKDINTEAATASLTRMIADMGGVLLLLDPLLNGGEFDPRSGFSGFMQNLFGNDREVLHFGKGLKNLEVGQLQDLAVGVEALRSALGVEATREPPTVSLSEGSTSNLETILAQTAAAATAAAASAARAADAAAAAASRAGGTNIQNNNTNINAGASSGLDNFVIGGDRR